MKCPNCNGVPYDEVWTCEVCNGKGIIEPLTNEEWFCQLPLTKKSEFLVKMVNEAIETHGKHGATWHESTIWWDGWLKQPHTKE